MQRYLALTVTALAFGAMSITAPAHAATGADEQQQEVIKHAVQALQNAALDHHFETSKEHVKGVFIVPSQKPGAQMVGASGEEGVLLVRRNNTWSDPAFFSIGSLAVGTQSGGEAGPVVMLLMTRKAVHAFENANTWSLNAKAGLTIGSSSAKSQAGTNGDDVIVWSQAAGQSGGANVSASGISQNLKIDHQYYDQSVDTAQILQGKTSNLSANKLRRALTW